PVGNEGTNVCELKEFSSCLHRQFVIFHHQYRYHDRIYYLPSANEELALLFPDEHENPENWIHLQNDADRSCRSRAANSCTSCGKLIVFHDMHTVLQEG
ncbi:18701_t:CDS:2, partial [Rhizophagus irregularis]